MLAYTSDPPPTPAPESTNTSDRKDSRRMPKHPSAGIQMALRTLQLVFGKSFASQRGPRSSTATR